MNGQRSRLWRLTGVERVLAVLQQRSKCAGLMLCERRGFDQVKETCIDRENGGHCSLEGDEKP